MKFQKVFHVSLFGLFILLIALFGSLGVQKVQAQAVSELFAGTVIDQAGNPLTGANVTVNGVAATSDKDGYFEVYATRTDRYVINVTKIGYALSSRIETNLYGNANLKIILMKVDIFSINPVQGGTITDASGTQIVLPANALVDVNGQLPAGNINVAIHTYNLTNESMPGDMSGLTSSGQPGYLVSAGAFWAEFTDSNGKKYNLASGKKATISIPTKQTAQTSIALWSYNETTGTWMEEGNAQLTNGRFQGQVSHFSAWNFDWHYGDPACVAFTIDQSFIDKYGDGTSVWLQAKVTNTLPSYSSIQSNYFTAGTHVIYNIPPYSTVDFFTQPSSPFLYGSVNAGAPWGWTGSPVSQIPPKGASAPYYRVCNGQITLAYLIVWTRTPTPPQTKTIPPTFTPTRTNTATASITPSITKTFTPTITDTVRASITITVTPTYTSTRTNTATVSITPSVIKTKTPTQTVTATPVVHIPACDIQIKLPNIHYLPPPADLVVSTYTVNRSNDTLDVHPGDNVCKDAYGYCTLRAAVMEANKHSGTDKILLPPNLYNMTRAGAGEDDAKTGDYDILESVFIESTAPIKSPLLTKIDARHLDRVFHVHTGTLTIDNLTVQNGNVGATDWGGNILVLQAGGLRTSNLIIRDGKGGSGGGVYFYKATAAAAKTNFIRSTILQNNEATAWAGGGVFVEQSLVKILDSQIIYNKANVPGSAGGWSAGGGMYITSGSTVTVHGSIMAYNETASNGGGIYNNGTLTINRSLLLKNKAAGAAGALIVDNGGTGNITNTTIACNQATKFGNVTLDGTAGLSVSNSTIVYNVAGWGSAVTEKVKVGNSILWGNRNTSNILDNCPFVSSGYNIVDSPFCAGDHHFFTNPNLGLLSNLSSYPYTLVYPLLPGSPAIDTASDAICLLLPTPRVDQRAVTRPQGVRCDRGAFELIP